jgi:hypothetical protein
VYADLALLFVPVAIILVSINLVQTNKRLRTFKKDWQDTQWSYGQIFSLLMVGASIFEVYKGFNGRFFCSSFLIIGGF